MSNVYDFLGDYRGYFHKASWQIYCDASGALQYVGKTGNEVTFAPNMEYAEWFTNTSGVQVLYVIAADKVDPQMQFMFMQPADPNIIPLVFNLDRDTSGATDEYSFIGSDPNALGEYEWRFVTQSIYGLAVTLVIRKGIATSNGDWTSGAPGDFGNIPVTVRMLQDTSITNTKRDLGYFIIEKRAFS